MAAPLLKQPAVTRSTMMGFACLRLDGDFFATCDHRSGDLVVKLDEQRVTALVDSGSRNRSRPTAVVSGSGPASRSNNAASGAGCSTKRSSWPPPATRRRRHTCGDAHMPEIVQPRRSSSAINPRGAARR
jgi:hypothetical protein